MVDRLKSADQYRGKNVAAWCTGLKRLAMQLEEQEKEKDGAADTGGIGGTTRKREAERGLGGVEVRELERAANAPRTGLLFLGAFARIEALVTFNAGGPAPLWPVLLRPCYFPVFAFPAGISREVRVQRGTSCRGRSRPDPIAR
jgi:hypothetical protein